MKYFSGLLLLIIASLFLTLPVLMVFKLSFTDIYEDPFLLSSIFIFGFGVLFLKGTYYCFKFADLFTKVIIFSDKEILLSDCKGSVERLPNDKITKVIYIKTLKLFEIHFNDLERKEIVIMNNSGHETTDFLLLKEFLLNSPKSIINWLQKFPLYQTNNDYKLSSKCQ